MQHSASSVQAIPARHLHDCLPLLGRRHVNATAGDQPCHMQITNNDAVTLQSVMLPDLLCTATTAIAPQQIIATLPLGHPWLRLISPTSTQTAGLCSNAKLVPRPSDNHTLLCDVVARKPIGFDAMILAHPTGLATDTDSVQLVGQFDGSCHRLAFLKSRKHIFVI